LKRFSLIIWTTFLIVATCAMVWAQATAQISGVAKDQSGAVLPGVEITATQADTGAARSAVTNETGAYVFPNLPIGPYKLEASLPGFRTFVQTGIVLQVNSSPTINVTLEVGQVTEQVQVEANAALVETRNIGVGSVVENTRILELPLNGRQAVELIALAGAASPAPLVDGSSRDPFAKASFSVAGGLNTGVSFTLDGAYHNNPQSNGYMSTPFPDALQEFKVETSAGAASGGAKSAGSVSLVTKSGTNEIHGDLFEFVRNGKFNARNFFATRRDTIKRNQFGGTAGGPIVKNKLFFFAGYQGTTLRQDPSDLTSFVPTAAMYSGDFTAFASPACNGGRAIALRAPFVNNRIDPALFSKAAVAYAKKLPTTNDPCGKIIYGNPTYENGHMVVARIDYQKSDKHSIFGRYLGEHVVDPAPYDLNHNLLSSAGNSTPRIDGFAQAFTVGSTYLFSANIVNAFRLTGNRIAAGKFEPIDLKDIGLGPADLGIKAYSYTSYFLPVSVTGGFTTSHTAGSARDAIFAANDDLSVLRGNHQMSFGASAAMWWVNSYTNTYHSRFTFNGATTGLGMADYFIGHASEYNAGPSVPQNKRDKAISLYGADTWKATPRLTVNYGLRWQPYTPMINRDGGSMTFDINKLQQGVKSVRFDNTPPGVFFNGDPDFPGDSGIFNRWWQFSPRLGLAWDVNGDGKTSIRASGGSSYDFPNTHYMVSLTSGPPWAPKFTVTDAQMDNPWANYPGGDQLPIKNGKDVGRDAAWPLYSAMTAVDPHTKNMQVVQWNLAVQRQVGTDWLASVSYLGSETSHMWSLEDINPAVFLGLGACTLNGVSYPVCSTTANQEQRRRFILTYPNGGAKFGDVTRIAPEATSSYNAMLLSIQRRAARGVTVNANYTWSHCISDHPQPEQTAFGTRGNWGWTNGNRSLDRGDCSSSATDRRQVFNVSSVAETPTFSSPALRMVASHWRFSPLVRILSGESIPLSVTTSQDRALNAMRNQRVDQVLGDVYGDGTPGNFLNVSAFALPALGTIGNLGMGSIKGPGQWQFDMAVSRSFQVREMQRVEFRAEAFNVTNSLHMKNPEVNFNSSLFGKVTTAYDPRIMQFALKYFF
jgi:hypothetical protein